MENESIKRIEDYRQSLEQLYSEVRSWVEAESYNTQEELIELDEPRAGRYQVPKLTIRNSSGKALAELVPVGAWIIGADWRVDVVGHMQNEVLVYWRSGAPELDIPEPENGAKRKERLFKGADKEGWYWIEDKKFGRARPVDKELLLDLISEVQPL
ncbi:MAG: hypothetical protein ACP5M0_15075 [Desulfomonilaceae bacterium]